MKAAPIRGRYFLEEADENKSRPTARPEAKYHGIWVAAEPPLASTMKYTEAKNSICPVQMGAP